MWREESSIWVEALETTSAMISFIRAQIYLLLIADLCFECWVCKAAFETVISFTASRLIKLRVLMSEKNRNKWLRREKESKAENGNNGYEEEIQQDHWRKKSNRRSSDFILLLICLFPSIGPFLRRKACDPCSEVWAQTLLGLPLPGEFWSPRIAYAVHFLKNLHDSYCFTFWK